MDNISLPIMNLDGSSTIWSPPDPIVNDDGTVDYPEGEGYPVEEIPEQNLEPVVVDEDDYSPDEGDDDV